MSIEMGSYDYQLKLWLSLVAQFRNFCKTQTIRNIWSNVLLIYMKDFFHTNIYNYWGINVSVDATCITENKPFLFTLSVCRQSNGREFCFNTIVRLLEIIQTLQLLVVEYDMSKRSNDVESKATIFVMV